MARKRLLLLLKPYDMYPFGQFNSVPRFTNSKLFHYLDNRRKVHKEAISFCQDVLRKKSVDWEPILRTDLSHPVHNFDLVVTVGGDGTLLQASHFIDDSIPVLGVNSDPTYIEEVEELSEDFDANRSTGYLCAANAKSFEQVLDEILEGQKFPSKLSRLSLNVNSQPLSTYALNDILLAHPCPATVSRFSFKIQRGSESCTPLVNCRSSGLRVSTAAGSTAAMLSAGGFPMPILSQEFQYIVREPITPRAAFAGLMHGVVKSDQSMEATWFTEKGLLFIDGSHVFQPIQYGDTIKLSTDAPVLRVFLPHYLLSENH